MDGIELAIRFSTITNQLHFCGPGSAQKVLKQYIDKKDNADEVRTSLEKFEGLYPYLKAIGDASGKDWLDYEVVEAYWIGNELLQETKETIPQIIEHLAQRGLPRSWADDLLTRIPEGALPSHLFNVIWVGVGKATGSVPTTLQNMDNCRPSWGTVKRVMKDHILVERQPLAYVAEQYCYGPSETRTVVYLPEFMEGVKEGDVIAMHWGFACLVLSKEQQNNLISYSEKVIDTINSTQS
ncbi:MAG: DUF6390 family protein [Candidatus Woesearchaeota archaeon]